MSLADILEGKSCDAEVVSASPAETVFAPALNCV